MKIEDVKPLGDRFIVKLKKIEQTTNFGLIIAKTDDSDGWIENRAEIIKLGDGSKLKELDLHVGDVVMFPAYGAIDIEGVEDAGEEKYKLLKYSDVIAVLS